MNKTVSILGSTGSIGTQSLEVCEKHGLKVIALAAHSSIEALEQQIRKFRPAYACIYNEEKYAELKRRISLRYGGTLQTCLAQRSRYHT
jgi:1-deoxy-D-xylulose-5-phosphate reductoisomerase